MNELDEYSYEWTSYPTISALMNAMIQDEVSAGLVSQSHVSLQRFRVLLLPSKESSKTKNDNIAICGGRNHPNWAIGKRNTVSRRSHPMDQGGGTLCNWCIRRTDFIQKESKEIPVIL